MARTIMSVVAPTSTSSVSTFVSWESLCAEIHGLETYFDSLITKMFIESGVVDPDSMKIRDSVPGWKIQTTSRNIREAVIKGVRGMWDKESQTGTLILWGTEISISAKEAACIQAAVFGSRKFGTQSILYNNYFISECRRRHSEYLENSGKADFYEYQKKGGGKEVTQKLNITSSLKKEVQAKA